MTWLVTHEATLAVKAVGSQREEAAARRLGQTLDGVQIHAEI